jgi:hypothetical protein
MGRIAHATSKRAFFRTEEAGQDSELDENASLNHFDQTDMWRCNVSDKKGRSLPLLQIEPFWRTFFYLHNNSLDGDMHVDAECMSTIIRPNRMCACQPVSVQSLRNRG